MCIQTALPGCANNGTNHFFPVYWNIGVCRFFFIGKKLKSFSAVLSMSVFSPVSGP